MSEFLYKVMLDHLNGKLTLGEALNAAYCKGLAEGTAE